MAKNGERKRGKSISIPSHSWKKHGGACEGKIVKVVRFVGTEYGGTDEKVQTRILMERDDGSRYHVFMPVRWAEIVAPYTGSYVWLTSSEPGSTETRYEAIPEEGSKAVTVEQIETVRSDGASEPF